MSYFAHFGKKKCHPKTLFQPTLNGIQDIDLINIVPINENFLSNIHTCMRQLNYIIMEIIAILNDSLSSIGIVISPLLLC